MNSTTPDAYLLSLAAQVAVARAEDNFNDADLHLDVTFADFEVLVDSFADHCEGCDEYSGGEYPAPINLNSADEFSPEEHDAIFAAFALAYRANMTKFIAEA